MDHFYTMDLNVSLKTILFVFLFTFLLLFPILNKTESILKKIFITFIFISYFLFSGVGICVLDDNGLYLFYYMTYTIALAISLYAFRNVKFKISINDIRIESFITRYKTIIILGYLLLQFSLFIFPENKLYNLISPPKVDTSVVMDILRGNSKVSYWFAIVNVITNILWPFFYMSLFKFKNRPLKLFLILLIQNYLIYCYGAYIARTTVVLNLIFYAFILYYYNIKYRRFIIVTSVIVTFFSILFLAAYASMRLGNDVSLSDISISASLESLFRIECTFPTWFEVIYKNSLKDKTFIGSYILWLVTQPIPGILKSWIVDFNLNVSIAQLLLGVKQEATTFFVPLTGIVGESVYIFGRYLFIIHAFILGWLLNIFINFCESRIHFKILLIYSIVFVGLAIGRTGTTGGMVYPFMIKTLVYVPLVLLLFKTKAKN